MDAPYTVRETPIATAVATESESASLVEAIEHAVVVEAEPEVMLVTAGEQGPPGIGAFDEWLIRNPGGTWAQFIDSIGSATTALGGLAVSMADVKDGDIPMVSGGVWVNKPQATITDGGNF